jgi:hypothetical protein
VTLATESGCRPVRLAVHGPSVETSTETPFGAPGAGVPGVAVTPGLGSVDVVVTTDPADDEPRWEAPEEGDISAPVMHPPMDTINRPIIAVSGTMRRRIVHAYAAAIPKTIQLPKMRAAPHMCVAVAVSMNSARIA